MKKSKDCEKKQAKRTARLWEDTVVTTLRDMQWQEFCKSLHKKTAQEVEKASKSFLSQGAVPPGFMKLDGHAESSLADVALATKNARYFLIEVKSEQKRIVDEWRKGGVFRPKKVYKRLAEAVKAYEGLDEKMTGAAQFLPIEQSLKCHLFAYWRVVAHKENALGGFVVAEPYLSGCIGQIGDHDRTQNDAIKKLRGIECHSLIAGSNGPVDPVFEAIKIFEARVRIVIHRDGIDPEVGSFGLRFSEFNNYVNYLCSKSEVDDINHCPGPLHAVVLSTAGFYRVVSNTSQLAEILRVVSGFKPSGPS